MVTLDSGLGRASFRSRLVVWVVAAVVLVAGLVWYVTHPTPLPTGNGHVEARTRVGTPVYIGVHTGQAMTVRSWSIDLEHGAARLLVCRDGSIGSTTSLDPFCSSTEPAGGAHLEPTDSLVLRVASSTSTVVEGGPVHLAWRDGIQLGEQRTGPTFSVLVTE